MQSIGVILSGVFALSILIFVHELGHFAVAKWFGIRVLKFSLGFGKKLIGFKRGETEYVISLLPLGGFVKMAGENPHEIKPEEIKEGDYFFKPWWVRLLVLLAGPGMNFITAAVILSFLFWVGFNVPIAQPQIVGVEQNSPAEQAGLQTGDVIKTMGTQSIENWETFAKKINQYSEKNNNQPVVLGIERQAALLTRKVVPAYNEKSKRWQLGITIAPTGTNLIERVFVGTPAELSGVKKGDIVIAVEGKKIWTKYDFQQIVWKRAGQETTLIVSRAGEEKTITLKPIGQQLPGQGKVGVIGVSFKISDSEKRMHYPFLKAVTLGTGQTYNISKMILSSLGQMISGKISAKDSLGGPITIMRMAGQEAKSGIKDFAFFIAGISVMLAILNLLPIPVLDGGSAVFFIIEGIMRKPLSMKIQEGSQRVGFALLIALMLFATFNDVYKLILSTIGGAQ